MWRPHDAGVQQTGDGDVVEITVDGARLLPQLADVLPLHEIELTQVIDIEEFVGFGSGEIAALASEEFQRVPLGAVVAGGLVLKEIDLSQKLDTDGPCQPRGMLSFA